MHLDDLIVDVSNMFAHRRFTKEAILEFKVVKTAGNDRTRSSLSSRKAIDTATANLPHKTTFFAKE